MHDPVSFVPDLDHMVTGLWCDVCALPSGIQVPITILSDRGVFPGCAVMTCVNCENAIEVEDDGDGQLVGA